MRILTVPALLVFVGTTSLAAQSDVERVLASAQKAYNTIKTFSAEFDQTIINPMLGDPEQSHGTLFLLPPHRFAMRFSDPAGDRIVGDGTWLWLFTPSTVPDQVLRSPPPEAGPATPNLFAQFVDRPLERYEAEYAGRDTTAGQAVDKIRLVPRTNETPFQRAVIHIARSNGIIRGLDLVEESGQRRSLVLRTIHLNAPIDDNEFVFTPPRGVKIISP